jgi:fermentation-respiration switch protein FrsA (DUF1100 family)
MMLRRFSGRSSAIPLGRRDVRSPTMRCGDVLSRALTPGRCFRRSSGGLPIGCPGAWPAPTVTSGSPEQEISAGGADVPVLAVQGTADESAPVSHAERLLSGCRRPSCCR